ncbi:MAG: CHAT domain-containing protein [Acidobacteriota bacterium]
MSFQELRPPDLEMRIRIAIDDRTRLRFILNSPNGRVALSHQEIEGPPLRRNPEEYQSHLLNKVEHLGKRLDVDGSGLLRPEIENKLASLGHDLWSELFSAELRAVYRDIIRPSVRSWVIISDEPWIPWELVKPYEEGGRGEPFDDDFLCLRFELTRWLAGGKPYVPQIIVRRLAVVHSAPDLHHASRERTLFDQMKETFPGLEVEAPRLDSASYVLDFLTSAEFKLIHFIGHGTPMIAHPDEAGLPFEDGSTFRPADLHGPLATSLGQTRPLVFLNACWAGKEGWSLTRLGGWAARWIGVCGCGAFVAPLWPVRDQAAVSFAWSFYGALRDGATLGEAALAARQAVARERPSDPSAYAYTVYGHPNARVFFQESPAEDASRGIAPPRQKEKDIWKPPPPRRLPRRLGGMGAALALAGLLHLAAVPLTDLFLAIDPAWTAQGRTVRDVQRPSLEKRSSKPAGPRHDIEAMTVSMGGVQFRVSASPASLQTPLKNALRHAAADRLAGQGISGWTITMEVGPPQKTTYTLDGSTQVTCQLTSSVHAKGPTSAFDLGSISGTSSQFDSVEACKGAAESLAEAILSGFAKNFQKGGES